MGSYLEHKKASAKWKKMFAAFVEGFHGADLNQIGIQGLLTTQQTDEKTLNGSQMFRHVQGYDQLLHGMHRCCVSANAVAPGPVWTPLNPSDAGASKEKIKKFGEKQPMQIQVISRGSFCRRQVAFQFTKARRLFKKSLAGLSVPRV
ncbi:MAG: hypothetical protein ACXWC9_09530 [Pseudobdellovibrionaceae bacterium]